MNSNENPEAQSQDLEPVALDAQVDLLGKYSECTRAIKYWTGELDRVKDLLAKAMGKSEVGTVNGVPVLTYKPQNRFRETDFKKQYPDMYRLYETERTTVKFDIELFKRSRPELYTEFQVRAMRSDFSG